MDSHTLTPRLRKTAIWVSRCVLENLNHTLEDLNSSSIHPIAKLCHVVVALNEDGQKQLRGSVLLAIIVLRAASSSSSQATRVGRILKRNNCSAYLCYCSSLINEPPRHARSQRTKATVILCERRRRYTLWRAKPIRAFKRIQLLIDREWHRHGTLWKAAAAAATRRVIATSSLVIDGFINW